MKYNDNRINKVVSTGQGLLKEVRAEIRKLGKGYITPNRTDSSTRMLTLIEKLKGLNVDHYGFANKAHYAKRFDRERESALAELWKMYEALQHYNENGVFLEGSQRGMVSFTTRLEDHLVRSNDESPKNGTFHRASEAHTKPITEGPLARVKGMVCELHGPRYESPKTFKMCSRVDEVNGGRSVMAIKETQNYRDSLETETYTVKLFPEATYNYVVGATLTIDPTNKQKAESADGTGMVWVDRLRDGITGKYQYLPQNWNAIRFSTDKWNPSLVLEVSEDLGAHKRISRMGDGRGHTVRVAVHKKIN